jgi:hypothetical protein
MNMTRRQQRSQNPRPNKGDKCSTFSPFNGIKKGGRESTPSEAQKKREKDENRRRKNSTEVRTTVFTYFYYFSNT